MMFEIRTCTVWMVQMTWRWARKMIRSLSLRSSTAACVKAFVPTRKRRNLDRRFSGMFCICRRMRELIMVFCLLVVFIRLSLHLILCCCGDVCEKIFLFTSHLLQSGLHTYFINISTMIDLHVWIYGTHVHVWQFSTCITVFYIIVLSYWHTQTMGSEESTCTRSITPDLDTTENIMIVHVPVFQAFAWVIDLQLAT